MKLSVAIFVFLLQAIILIAKPDPIIKFYVIGDSSISYNVNDISNLKFQEFSYSCNCNVYFKKDSISRIPTYLINDITISKENNNITYLLFSNSTNYNQTFFKLPLHEIDSIIFENTNKLFGKIYSNIEIKIQGLSGVFKNERHSYFPDKYENSIDTSSVDIKPQIINKFYLGLIRLYDCERCRYSVNNGNLNFCFDKQEEGGEGNESYRSCYSSKISLSIDTTKLIIDTLFYHLKNIKNIWRASGGSWRNDIDIEEKLILTDIPFNKNIDGSITAIFNINANQNIKYSYYDKNFIGTNGVYTEWQRYFTGFLPPLDSATISIVIRE